MCYKEGVWHLAFGQPHTLLDVVLNREILAPQDSWRIVLGEVRTLLGQSGTQCEEGVLVVRA